MMKVSFLLPFLSLALAVPNPLQGVWEGHFDGPNVDPGQVDCLITAQFLPLDYLAIISGCGNSNANGVSMGLYFLAQDILTVYYAGSYGAGGVPGTYIDIDWYIDSQGMLHLSNSDQGWSEVFTKLPSASYDGVWAGQSSVNGTVVSDVYAEFLSTTYLSFPDIYYPNYGAFIGLAPLESGNKMPIYYALTNDDTSSQIGTTAQTDFTSLNPGFSLNHAPYEADPNQKWLFTAQTKQPTNSVLQGVWIGYTQGCATTIDFRANLYRVFQTSCIDVQNTGLHFGVWSALPDTSAAMTSLTLYYAYSTFGLEGTNETYNISVLNGNSIFHLTGPFVNGDYYKVADQATTIVLLITLQGDYTTFPSSQTGFIDDLSSVTDISPTLITIRDDAGIDSQSFTVTVQFCDDPATGAKATDVPNKLMASPQLGNYLVTANSIIVAPYKNSGHKTVVAIYPLLLLVSLILYGTGAN